MTRWHRLAGWCVAVTLCAGTVEAAPKNFAAPSTSVAQSSGDRVNVRSGASLNYEALTQLSAGERVLVTGQDGEWSQVRLPRSARCYVSAKFVERQGTTAQPTTDRLNVRARPATTASIVGQIHRDHPVTIVEETGGWYRIQPLPDWIGYVKSELLKPDPTITVEQFLAMRDSEFAQSAGSSKPGPAAIATAKPSRWTQANRPLLIGEIQRAGGWFKPPASHRLIVEGRTAAFLSADQYPLAQLEHQTVAIWGDQQASAKSKTPLVRVTRLELVSTNP